MRCSAPCFALVACFSCAGTSYAQSIVPVNTPAEVSASSQENSLTFAELIAAGRYAEAFSIVERRVMLHPDDVMAWIDYANVIRALGRDDEARAVVAFIERELAPDASQRKLIGTLSPPDRDLSRHQWRGEINVLTGRESNANSGPSIRELTLTTPGQVPVVRELAPQSLPQPSATHLMEVRLESAHNLGQGVNLSTLLDWRQRNTPDVLTARSRQWQVDAMLTFNGSQNESTARQWFVTGSQLDYDYGGGSYFERQRLALGVDQQFGLRSATPCRIQGTLEREWRHHLSQDGLISDLSALQLAGVCAYGPHRLSLLLRSGNDKPRVERPGDDQSRQDVMVGYRVDLSQWGQLDVLASYAHSRDESTYNILFGDERRRIKRSQLNLGYVSRPFFENWQFTARAEIFHQRSNIALFRMRGKSVHVGVRYNF